MTQANAMRRKLMSFAMYAAVFLAPFAIATGSWSLAEHFAPGQVSVTQWRLLASTSFLVAALVTVVMTFRSRLYAVTKFVLSVAGVVVYLFLAFFFSLQSRCGDEPTYIGQQRNLNGGTKCQN